MHNALKQTTLEFPQFSLKGFSISGLSTYIQIPEMDLCFDMGECPLSAIGLNHVFLSHAHGDHSRCLMRHQSLRKMLGVAKDAYYYIPDFLYDGFKKVIEAEAIFEGVPAEKFNLPKIIPVEANKIYHLEYRKDLAFKSFDVHHSKPSRGHIIYHYKQKLKEEYLKLGGTEIKELRLAGVEITKPVYSPKICFVSDSLSTSLFENDEIWEAEVLIIESTFLGDDEVEMAKLKGHTHILEIAEALETFKDKIKCNTIVLNHFSMKYHPKFIAEKVKEAIPEEFHSKIKLFMNQQIDR